MNRRLTRSAIAILVVMLTMPSAVLASAPAPTDDSYHVDEDSGANVLDVLSNDTSDAGTNVIQGASNPPHGTASTNGATVTYTPDADYSGPDSFTYTVQNDDGQATGNVDITVDPDNDPPNAVGDSRTVIEDTTTDLALLGNDTDPDGDTLTIIGVTQGGKGSTSIVNGATQIRYDPNPNATGSDSFQYTISDGHGGQDTANVTITITPVNDPPTADDDSATVTEDTPKTIFVLANDDDVDVGDTLSVVDKTNGSKGSVSIATDHQSVTYVPNPNAFGSDSFSYTISDGDDQATATVNVTITAVEDPPAAVDDIYTINEDATTLLDVRANDGDVDGDALSISDITTPALGTATEGGGKVEYDPTLNANGTDTFDYTIDDGHGGQDTATVTVHITPVNDPPVADDDEFGVAEDSPAILLAVLAGDTDPDGDPLTISAKTNGAKGTVVITGGGTGLTYKPGANLSGNDSFTYTISDGHGGTATATVTVEIGGTNDDPNAVNDPSMTVPEGAGATAIDVLANDSDPDGDELVIASKTNGAHGTVVITGSGTGLTYNPRGNYHGSDSFTYTLSDGHGGSDHATVLVTVVKDAVDPTITTPLVRFYGQTVGTSTTKVRVSWTGADAGSGVHDYRLQVSTNDGSFKTVTLATATSTSGTVSLRTGSSYRFRVRVADNEGNSSHYAYSRTLTILRSGETSSAVAYVGTWSKSTTKNALGGTARFSSSPSKSATYSFDGTDVAWIATRATSSGKAKVFIDGVLVTTVDLDTSKTKYKQLVVQRHLDVGGSHTMRIEPVGDGRVDIDGFAILR